MTATCEKPETSKVEQTVESLQPGTLRDGVLVGKDGWLFLHDGDHRKFDYLTGRIRPNDASVANFWDNIRARTEFCRSSGIPYVHVLFPPRALVVPEHLPDGHADNLSSVFLRWYLPKCQAVPANLVYSPDLFREQSVSAFRRQDTHISFDGALVTVNAVLRQFRLAELVTYDEMSHVMPIYGDLAAMLGTEERSCERMAYFPGEVFDNLPALPGNTNNISLLTNKHARLNKRLLCIGDSFIKEALPLFSHVFSTVLYIRSPGFQPAALARYRPDFVVTQSVEKYLASVNPDDEVPDVLDTLAGLPSYAPPDTFRAALHAHLPDATGPASE